LMTKSRRTALGLTGKSNFLAGLGAARDKRAKDAAKAAEAVAQAKNISEAEDVLRRKMAISSINKDAEGVKKMEEQIARLEAATALKGNFESITVNGAPDQLSLRSAVSAAVAFKESVDWIPMTRGDRVMLSATLESPITLLLKLLEDKNALSVDEMVEALLPEFGTLIASRSGLLISDYGIKISPDGLPKGNTPEDEVTFAILAEVMSNSFNVFSNSSVDYLDDHPSQNVVRSYDTGSEMRSAERTALMAISHIVKCCMLGRGQINVPLRRNAPIHIHEKTQASRGLPESLVFIGFVNVISWTMFCGSRDRSPKGTIRNQNLTYGNIEKLTNNTCYTVPDALKYCWPVFVPLSWRKSHGA